MRTSCGIIIVNQNNEIFMGHVTGKHFYDIPKGNLDEGEEPIDCAIRECREETSMVFDAQQLTDLGKFAYNKEKKLHLFLTHVEKSSIKIENLFCDSFFEHYYTKKQTPEIDGFKWVKIEKLLEACPKSMGNLLTLLGREGTFNKSQTLHPRL